MENGIKIDNQTEDFPFLNINGVTYLPVTWQFAYEIFDREYSFDEKNGLIINTANAVRRFGITPSCGTHL